MRAVHRGMGGRKLQFENWMTQKVAKAEGGKGMTMERTEIEVIENNFLRSCPFLEKCENR